VVWCVSAAGGVFACSGATVRPVTRNRMQTPKIKMFSVVHFSFVVLHFLQPRFCETRSLRRYVLSFMHFVLSLPYVPAALHIIWTEE
jgi:hypothetical protein